jgi:hypothetical protein
MLTGTGLIGMQINMAESGTFLFISDHCHVSLLSRPFENNAHKVDTGNRKLA